MGSGRQVVYMYQLNHFKSNLRLAQAELNFQEKTLGPAGPLAFRFSCQNSYFSHQNFSALQTHKVLLTEVNMVFWMADIWAEENTASSGTCGLKSLNSSLTAEWIFDGRSPRRPVLPRHCAANTVVCIRLKPKVCLCALHPLWGRPQEQPWMAASAEFMANLSFSTSQARLPGIGR